MLEPLHIWVIAGLMLWIVEIVTPGFVAGVFGVACLMVAPLAAAGFTFKAELLVFGLATAVMSLAIRPLILKYFYRAETEIRTNVHALIGETGLVTEIIDYAYGTGRVKIGGEVWRAITQDRSRVDVGAKVVVRAIEGCKLVVEMSCNAEKGSS